MRHTLIFHIIKLSKKLQKVVGFKKNPLLLSHSQASALLVIDSQKEISQRELAHELHLEPASIVTLVDELEKLKLAQRGQINGDRRKYQITLTPKGKEKVKLIKNRIFKLDNYLKSKLSPKEIAIFDQAIEKLTAYLDDWRGGENEISSTKRHLAA